MSGYPIIRVRTGRGETVRAEFLGMADDGRVHIRYLLKIEGRAPESCVHTKRIIGGLPEGCRS